MHARHLGKHVRGRFPQVPVVVGLWNAEGDLDKAKTRLGAGATMHVVTTLRGCAETSPHPDSAALATDREKGRRPIEFCRFTAYNESVRRVG